VQQSDKQREEFGPAEQDVQGQAIWVRKEVKDRQKSVTRKKGIAFGCSNKRECTEFLFSVTVEHRYRARRAKIYL
jgi:hypothetical protein